MEATQKQSLETMAPFWVQRQREAAQLFREWLQDESGYDERAWPAIEQALTEDGLRIGHSDEPSSGYEHSRPPLSSETEAKPAGD